MPTAKRLKSDAKAEVRDKPPARPTVADLEGESEFAQLAKQHWLKTSKRTGKVKVKNDVLKKEIWDVLEKDAFPYKSLLVLEGLQTLERYSTCPGTIDTLKYDIVN
jgi:intron-binding protein aquarius